MTLQVHIPWSNGKLPLSGLRFQRFRIGRPAGGTKLCTVAIFDVQNLLKVSVQPRFVFVSVVLTAWVVVRTCLSGGGHSAEAWQK